jgi:hypothetical protein
MYAMLFDSKYQNHHRRGVTWKGRRVTSGVEFDRLDFALQHLEFHVSRIEDVYDLVVHTRSYNFVMWGSSPRVYVAFVRQALSSSLDGEFLDAGCGSLLFVFILFEFFTEVSPPAA